jgi:3-methyladenine DNA glycosylase/8-oxoguanine DNA glycosylase
LPGALDDAAGFGAVVAGHPLLRALHGRFPGIRIGRTRRVMEALVPAIIEQKVTGDEARAAFVALVHRHGVPAPGPWDDAPGSRLAPLRVPPDAETLAGLPGYAYHPLGLERRRADAIRFAAAHAVRAEECTDMALPDAYARLRAFPLVGAWTAAEVGLRALGDPDAVSVGDYHLCHAVCRALAGEPRGSDERMLELLTPFAGHRARVDPAHRGGGHPRAAPRPALRPAVDRGHLTQGPTPAAGLSRDSSPATLTQARWPVQGQRGRCQRPARARMGASACHRVASSAREPRL